MKFLKIVAVWCVFVFCLLKWICKNLNSVLHHSHHAIKCSLLPHHFTFPSHCLICIAATARRAAATPAAPPGPTDRQPSCSRPWCKCGSKWSWCRMRSCPWRICLPDHPHPRRSRSVKLPACRILQWNECHNQL